MLIIHGYNRFGKVDTVPGLVYVKTQFFHVWFFPVLPKVSYVIRVGTESEEGFQGVPISLSAKSVAFAYLRAILVVALIIEAVGALIAATELINGNNLGWTLFSHQAALLAGLGLLLWLTHVGTRAKPMKALQLATQAGVSPEEVAKAFASHPNIESIIEEFKHGQEAHR